MKLVFRPAEVWSTRNLKKIKRRYFWPFIIYKHVQMSPLKYCFQSCGMRLSCVMRVRPPVGGMVDTIFAAVASSLPGRLTSSAAVSTAELSSPSSVRTLLTLRAPNPRRATTPEPTRTPGFLLLAAKRPDRKWAPVGWVYTAGASWEASGVLIAQSAGKKKTLRSGLRGPTDGQHGRRAAQPGGGGEGS